MCPRFYVYVKDKHIKLHVMTCMDNAGSDARSLW